MTAISGTSLFANPNPLTQELGVVHTIEAILNWTSTKADLEAIREKNPDGFKDAIWVMSPKVLRHIETIDAAYFEAHIRPYRSDM